MSSLIDNMTEKEWEAFCEIMLRYHYTQKNFWTVPDKDGGDCGIEFFTSDGTIFQCYYPDLTVGMKKYKQKIQKKIREDLSKLKTYEKEISEIIGDLKINQWVLLTQENRSKNLLTYCNKKKKDVAAENISFIDNDMFQVKIETADSFPDAKMYAQNVYCKTIDIPIKKVTLQDKDIWKQGNSEFTSNIERKSKVLIGSNSDDFQDQIVTKYLQIEKFLDQLREEHPDLHSLIEDSARAQLDEMKEASVFEEDIDKEFVQRVVKNNKEAFNKHSKFFSDTNVQSLSFGYLSKWLAECYMDFTNGK